MTTNSKENKQFDPVNFNHQGFEEFSRKRDGARMILIPAGPCVIGTTEEEAREIEARVPWYPATTTECPVARPITEEYLIDRYEVTSAMFANFLNDIGVRAISRDEMLWAIDDSRQPLCVDAIDFVTQRGLTGSDHAVGVTWRNGNWAAIDGSEHCPITLVTWFGALAYARYVGCRLPMEIEWEKAARGPDGRRFPWGDNYVPALTNTADRWLGREIPDQQTWDESFHQNGHGHAWLASRPLPVGSIKGGESFYGCEDMIGNVAEWCSDIWTESPCWKNEHQIALSTDTFRSMRGAGRYGYGTIARCACRRRRDPQSVSENLGFRCASTLEY